MRSKARGTLASLVVLAGLGLLAPAAHALSVSVWEAGTCEAKECTYASIKSHPKEAFTQAAGHPEWGITSFEVNAPGGKPEEQVKRIRVDVPEGLAANPQALPSCTRAEFDANPALCELKGAKVGEAEAVSALEDPLLHTTQQATNTGKVYNLAPEPGLPLLFGIAIEPTGGVLLSPIHLMLEGHVSWGFEPTLAARGIASGDFHEWFQIDGVPRTVQANVLGIPVAEAKLSTVKSKLFFEGRKGGHFLTLPSACSSSTTSYLELESYEGGRAEAVTHTPVGVENCGAVPFKPTVAVKPATSQYDAPDGAETVVTVPQSDEINTADIKDAHVTLPEGLTLNPSAANGLQACTQAQLDKGGTAPVACPAASKIGTVLIETALPKGSLAGNVYLGKANGTGAITDPPYLIFIDAETIYGVSVRLEGTVAPNPATGRLEVSFANNPQLPFSELRLTVNGGEHAPLANPLTCTPMSTDFFFTPYTAFAGPGGVPGGGPAIGSTPFAASGCPASIPFSLSQGTADSSNKAGAYTHYTFNLGRADGQQYLSRVLTVLPAGLVGAIPSVTLCGEPQAASGSCPAASQIGIATVTAGAGDPYPFSGPVYLTGPYAGAPYGLSIPIEAAAGPFDLGRLTTRATIGVDPHSGRVIATSTLPTIFKGVPLRLRNISVAVNRENFLFNPTNCGALSTNTTLTSTFNASQGLASPFAVTSCNTLPFKPAFSAATSASTNATKLKANGASLRVNLLQGAHQANIHSVIAELPKSLPSRLTTLQKACPEATYAANPFSCPVGSKVGSATVTTPVLPEPLKGPAYLVSHGGAAFPDLDLLLEGDNGVRVILEGNTNIKKGITTSTFASIPDVPVSSFALELPTGPNSALTAVGTLCTQALTMPTTVTAQSGAVLKLKTPIAVSGCRTRLKILSKRIAHNRLILRVQAFAAGRVSVKSRYLRTTFRKLAKAGKFTIKVPLSRKGVSAERAHRLKFKARVGFLPKSKAEAASVAFTRIGFNRKSTAKRKH
jgi:hypothetical protein